MPERLKDMFFTKESVANFVKHISRFYKQFDASKFYTLVYSPEWEGLELKARMRHLTLCLRETLPADYKKAIKILWSVSEFVKGFEGMVCPDFVEVYGLDDEETSLPALKRFTEFSSSEFSIRPFLDRDPKGIMKFMLECAVDKHENIRRFSSEGCRPRLPWAMALPKFKKDPSLILKLLEKLKDDDSLFVRKSVANNLNDISKDNPDLVLKKCETWIGKSVKTDWIIKQACRTLLKLGDKRALILFGFSSPDELHIHDLNISKTSLKIGEDLQFGFTLHVKDSKGGKVRLEYAVYYMKANGKTSKKVFQITENSYAPGEYTFSKKQTFKEMTTRKHYPGKHELAVIINGEEKQRVDFLLKKP